jgi:hypothetical protein
MMKIMAVYGKCDIFEMINSAYAEYSKPSEHLALDEVIVLFKRRVIFKPYIPKQHRCFGITVFKLWDLTRYTYDIKVYLGKDQQCASQNVMTTHASDGCHENGARTRQ